MAAPKGINSRLVWARAHQRDAQALELRLQGVALGEIARRVGWDCYESARRGVNRELKRRGLRMTPLYIVMPTPTPAALTATSVSAAREELLEAVG